MRVALAIAMYMRPDLLILDEPTNHLDTETSAALIEALQDFQVRNFYCCIVDLTFFVFILRQ